MGLPIVLSIAAPLYLLIQNKGEIVLFWHKIMKHKKRRLESNLGDQGADETAILTAERISLNYGNKNYMEGKQEQLWVKPRCYRSVLYNPSGQ